MSTDQFGHLISFHNCFWTFSNLEGDHNGRVLQDSWFDRKSWSTWWDPSEGGRNDQSDPTDWQCQEEGQGEEMQIFKNPSQLKSIIPLATKGKTQNFRQEIHIIL